MIIVTNPVTKFSFNLKGEFICKPTAGFVLQQGFANEIMGEATLTFNFTEGSNTNWFDWELKITFIDYPGCELDFNNNVVTRTGNICELNNIFLSKEDKIILKGFFDPVGLALAFNVGDVLSFECKFSSTEKLNRFKNRLENFKKKVPEIGHLITE